MRTLILTAAIPLFLLGGCSTLRGEADNHDAHHPKMVPPAQESAAAAPSADGMNMAAKADMMENCPMMKGDKAGMPMSGDEMMKNCPMKDGQKAADAPH